MKRKHITFVVVLILFVFAAACGPEENIQESQTDKTEELEKAEGLEEMEKAVEELTSEEETAAAEESLIQNAELTKEERLNRNYYNKELCYWNGSVYGLRKGGLYRRADNEEEWELLCELSLTPQKSMEIYDHER